jgi:probable rRNA maturation factor
MKTTVQNRQEQYPLNLSKIRNLTALLSRLLAAEHPETGLEHTGVILLDDPGMQALNGRYFQKDRPTDVISFRYAAVPGAASPAGEVLVNVDRAVQVGPRHQGVSLELALYIAHGVNHLSGADDATPAERAAMRRTERRWLRAAAAKGLTEGLVGETGRREGRDAI